MCDDDCPGHCLCCAVLCACAVPVPVQLPQRIHRGPVVWLEWSYDNSQIFSAGLDGALCVWSAADGSCLRSITCVRTQLLAGRCAVASSSSSSSGPQLDKPMRAHERRPLCLP